MSEDPHYIVEDNIDQQPVTKNQVKHCPTCAEVVHMRQQAHIKDCHNRSGHHSNQGNKELKSTNKRKCSCIHVKFCQSNHASFVIMLNNV